MSDKITKTVVYEIEPSGDCGKCDCYYDVADYGWICAAFDNTEWNKSNIEQRPECREFLTEQKSRVSNIGGIKIKIKHQRSEIGFSIDTYKVKIYINKETADELLQKHSDNIPLDAIIEQPENLKLHGLVGLCFDKNVYYLEFKLIGANK